MSGPRYVDVDPAVPGGDRSGIVLVPVPRWRVRAARDLASIWTPAQREAIEGLPITAPDHETAAVNLLAVLGLALIEDDPANCWDCGAPFNEADATPSGKCQACQAGDFYADKVADLIEDGGTYRAPPFGGPIDPEGL